MHLKIIRTIQFNKVKKLSALINLDYGRLFLNSKCELSCK